MREKYNQLYRYTRLVVKPVGIIFTLIAITLVGAQILGAVGGTVGTAWLVLFFIGFGFWALDSVLSALEDWNKISEEIKEHPKKSSK